MAKRMGKSDENSHHYITETVI